MKSVQKIKDVNNTQTLNPKFDWQIVLQIILGVLIIAVVVVLSVLFYTMLPTRSNPRDAIREAVKEVVEDAIANAFERLNALKINSEPPASRGKLTISKHPDCSPKPNGPPNDTPKVYSVDLLSCELTFNQKLSLPGGGELKIGTLKKFCR
jgi:hypothetical protein